MIMIITYLPTLYKFLTVTLTEKTYNFLEENNLLPPEQRGCKRVTYGCKDQLLINKMILEDCTSKKKNLSTAWIDYQKAFDSVPHSWILKVMEIYKVSAIVTKFVQQSMTNWKTVMILNNNKDTISSRSINIKRGIFQGDSLSPLLFCHPLAPLSYMLNNTKCGYEIYRKKVNHLFYVDDLELFARNDGQLERLLTTVKEFSNDIAMQFGLDKSAIVTFKREKLVRTSNIQVDTNTIIQELEQEGTYKYLGINEGDGIQHAKTKEKIRKEHYRRVGLVTRSELNAINKIQAINTLAILVVILLT